MNRFIVALAIVFAFAITAPTSFADETEDKAAKALEALGAKITRDKDMFVAHVRIFSDKVTDDDLKHVASFKNLFSLDVASQKVTGAGLKHLESLEKLRSLSLFECPIKDEHMKHLGKVKSITTLTLNGTDITDEGVKELIGLKLIDLKLGNTDITNDSLKSLAKITTLVALNLTTCAIDDAGIVELAALKELNQIYLNNSDVTAKGVALLKKSLPECNIQNISDMDRVSASKKDIQGLALLAGTWKIEKSEPNLEIKEVVFKANRMTVVFADGSKTSKFRVDSTAKPMKMDGNGPTIYEVDGDTLRICFSNDENDRNAARPKEIKASPKTILLTLKKQK